MYYDHFLARNWDRYCDVPLPRFAATVYDALLSAEVVLPERMVNVCRAMAAGDWLGSYARVEAIDTALQRMSRRLTRPNQLGTGVQALVENYDALELDFQRFFPELQRFASAACLPQV
jgi:acyl carrier protein phosphodiesterase